MSSIDPKNLAKILSEDISTNNGFVMDEGFKDAITNAFRGDSDEATPMGFDWGSTKPRGPGARPPVKPSTGRMAGGVGPTKACPCCKQALPASSEGFENIDGSIDEGFGDWMKKGKDAVAGMFGKKKTQQGAPDATPRQPVVDNEGNALPNLPHHIGSYFRTHEGDPDIVTTRDAVEIAKMAEGTHWKSLSNPRLLRIYSPISFLFKPGVEVPVYWSSPTVKRWFSRNEDVPSKINVGAGGQITDRTNPQYPNLVAAKDTKPRSAEPHAGLASRVVSNWDKDVESYGESRNRS